MRMNDVELVRAARYGLKLNEQRYEVVPHVRIEAQGPRPDWSECGLGHAVSRGEQGNLVSELHESIGEVRDDTLGAAVEFRRHGLGERCNLRNFHGFPTCCERSMMNRILSVANGIVGSQYGTERCKRTLMLQMLA